MVTQDLKEVVLASTKYIIFECVFFGKTC